MDYLGLGINLDLHDNIGSKVAPIMAELKALQSQANSTNQVLNGVGNYNPYSMKYKNAMKDYYASTKDLGTAMNYLTKQLVIATVNTNHLANATNRMQFSGGFNRMYSQMMRVNTMIGNMGFGMSKMQREMSNTRAYDMVNYRIKDLHDRIKLTTKGIEEMSKSPDSSKFVKEIALANSALQTYKSELSKAGSLQKKLADTHGYGMSKNNGKDVLYEKESNPIKATAMKAYSLAMRDVQFASNMAYNSLNKTGKLMTGMGYTTMEARQQLTRMSSVLTTTGMAMTQFTVGVGVAIGAIGMLTARWEDAVNVMHARTLMPQDLLLQTSTDMKMMSVDTGMTMIQTAEAMSQAYNSYADKGLGYVYDQTERALFMSKVWGISSEKAIADTNKIMQQYGVTSEKAWDMYVAGATNARKEMGKGFTGMGGIDRISNFINESPEKFLELAGSTKEFNGAYQVMVDNLEKGTMEHVLESIGMAGVLITNLVDALEPLAKMVFTPLQNGLVAIIEFLDEHPRVKQMSATLMLLGASFLLLIAPIALVTGLLIRYRNVFSDTANVLNAFGKGGLAVLSPQGIMARNSIRAFTVAVARLPQTILTGALPALYSLIRAFPALVFNMMKFNPALTAIGVGALLYSKNIGGFADKVNFLKDTMTKGWEDSTNMLTSLQNTSSIKIDLKEYPKWVQALTKVRGTIMMVKRAYDILFKDAEGYTAKELNLMKSLGIEGYVEGIAKAINATKNFVEGFVEGIGIGIEHAWLIGKALYETFEPVIDFILDGLINIANFISKLFGGEGNISTLEDLKKNAKEMGSSFAELGKVAGIALTAFLGFKVASKIFGGMRTAFSPFLRSTNSAIKSVGLLRKALMTLPKAVTTKVSAVSQGISTASLARQQARQAVAPHTIAGGGMNTGTLSNRQQRRLTPQQRETYNRTVANNQTRDRRDRGTAVHGREGQRYGSTLYARRQGRVRRALFGQSYDTYNNGRRVEQERRGGIFNRDRTNMNRTPMSERMRQAPRRTMQAVGGAGRAVGRGAMGAGRAIAQTPTAQRVGGAGRAVGGAVGRVGGKAMKPITVPVRYVVQRLRTAGVIKQASTAGTQSGNRFKRAFNASTRTLGAGGRMFTGVVRGAGRAGGRAGRGMLGGMKFMSKGITGIFSIGLRAIPFLGWALMAWDIISTIFTNWSAITNAAQNAWNWIKTSGMDYLGQAWDWIKNKANEIWNWIKTDGGQTFTDIATKAIEFLGDAFTNILELAGQCFVWILEDGIAMALSLGADLLTYIGEAFPKIVTFAIEEFTSLIGSALEIGAQVGSALWETITGALAGIGDWISEKISSATSFLTFGMFGGEKKYAQGGIITHPHVGMVGEDGAESIIPLTPSKRNRGLHLFRQTASILGVDITGNEGRKKAIDSSKDISVSKTSNMIDSTIYSQKGLDKNKLPRKKRLNEALKNMKVTPPKPDKKDTETSTGGGSNDNISININGYNKDVNELASEIAKKVILAKKKIRKKKGSNYEPTTEEIMRALM